MWCLTIAPSVVETSLAAVTDKGAEFTQVLDGL